MNNDIVQCCNLDLDMNKLKNEVLQFSRIDSYGNNNKWSKLHFYDCLSKKDLSKCKLWDEIKTKESSEFHKTIVLDDYIFTPNPNLYLCPYIKEILSKITDINLGIYICDISLLEKNGKVGLHRDHDIRPYMNDETKWIRLHIPIVTNPDIEFIMNNKRYDLKEGILYKLRTIYPHSVENKSNEDRYHLIIDVDPKYINKDLVWFSC